MLKERVNRCVLLRVCVLLSVLCVCAHIYVEFSGYGLKNWKRVHPVTPKSNKQDPKHQRVSKTSDRLTLRDDSKTTCCPPVQQQRKSLRWKIELEPWASESHSLEEEAFRFIKYITTPQVFCENPGVPVIQREVEEVERSWVLCLDNRFSLAKCIIAKHCRVYSLGLGGEDKWLERVLAKAGCEVHSFDPSIKEAHLQDSHMWLHRLSVDWRDPNPAIRAQRQHGSTKKLATILNDFGHRQVITSGVDVLKVDMESAEWKILENLILEGVLSSVGLLLLEIHVHWPGFEVGGDEPSVVRYWFSLLRELERAHFCLYHSYSNPAKPRLFLHKNLHNASSSYVLGWVNTHYSPQ
ncbi:probable methyltransferase-like protein 24 isoform X1 [Astyanax mexicanus]|uniref:Methyltransferase like 24 n=1 Tax=Astyanax mexicanus TaxID=7994 RepID=W5L3J3_ASTMX|nr:probable methyltransferase-like protein 24 isoform X1 [Astyanax mexicanus]